jgi:hypothetical protein
MRIAPGPAQGGISLDPEIYSEADFPVDESLPTESQIMSMNRMFFVFLIIFGFTATLRAFFAFSGPHGALAHNALGAVLVAQLLLLLVSWVVVLVLPDKRG